MKRRIQRLEHGAGTELSRLSFESAIRPQRLLLSGIAAVLVGFVQVNESAALGTDLRVIIIGVALANALWNTGQLLRLFTRRPSRRLEVAQALVDAFLALAAATVANASSSPLVWVLMLVPIIDVAVRFGAAGAIVGWLAVGSSYVFLLSARPSSGSQDPAAVGAGFQQVAAVAVIAVPMLIIISRLRSELEISARSRAVADTQESHLRGITDAAREFSEADSPYRALQLAVDSTLRFGFDRVDVCTRQGEEPWRLAIASGSPASVPPHEDGLLVRSMAAASRSSVGVSEPGVQELQSLHKLGYRAAVVAVVEASEDESVGLRAYSIESVSEESPILDSIETLVSLCASAWVSARKRELLEHEKHQADYESKHDSLTRIPNRSAVYDALTEAIRDERTQTAVMFIDLNGFKAINDELGHAAGDATLLAVATRLRTLANQRVFVARLGGDEFVLIVRGYGRSELDQIANDVIDKVTAPIEVDGEVVMVGASIGIAEHAGEDESTLLNRADELMYLAKQESRTAGRSIYRFGSSVAA